MNITRVLTLSFCVLITSLYLEVSAQKTSIYTNPQASYDQAIDLYTKAKYGSAQVIFDRLALGEMSNIQAGSEYYAAMCAAQLFHPDATMRFEKFIGTYPQNAQVNDACFELGKLQLTNKEYNKALKSFEKVDRFELTEEQQNEYYFKVGYAYFKTDNLKKARENFALLIDKPNKYNIPANYYYAHIAYSEKNYETALKHFEQVSTDETFRDVVNYYIVQIYALQGRYDELLAKSLPLLEMGSDKKTAEIARLTADAYFHQKEYKTSLKYFNQYLDSKPTSVSPVDNYEIAFANYKNGNYPQAIKYFQLVATGQDSLSQNAYYHLGDCYIKTNQKRFAFNAFNSAFKIKADPALTEEALFNYAKLAVELSYNPYNEAVNALQEYLNKYPESVRRDELYGYLADLYLLTKNYKNALTSIQQIKKRNTRLDAAYQKIAYYRGVELFNETDYDGSILLFAQSRDLTSDNSIKALSSYWSGEAYYRTARWDKAVDAFNKFLVTPGATSQPYFSTADYNIGYCYFKKKDYSKAAASFRKYLSGRKTDIKMTADANLRLGDCYFMTKDYSTATEYYQKAAASKVTDADYAMYQAGISYGVQGDMENKIATLRKMLTSYSKSNYTDDALYEIGLTYNVLNRDGDALTYFQRVVKEFPNSTYVKKSLLKTGLIYFNQNRNEEALATLKRVAKDYPGTPEAKEALSSIKSIYVEMNQVDEYVDFTKEVPQGDISRSEQDSLTYIAAENQYMNGNCDKANTGFTKYISKFPEGSFILEANFYKAECDFRSQKFDQALKSYEFIMSQQRSRFTSNAAARTAQIHHTRNNYEAALESYIRLEETADQPGMIINAVAGQMQCNYALKRYGLAIQSAQKLLPLDKLTENLATEAHFTIARSAYELGNAELARKEFEETAKLSKNEMAAEAEYMLAQLEFENAKYDVCEKSIFALSENYASYDYWVAKGFLLLSDVYVKKGNTFQAKQTLQSIIDNYEGKDLVAIAREKLALIGDTP
jgi:TolA-binding protein